MTVTAIGPPASPTIHRVQPAVNTEDLSFRRVSRDIREPESNLTSAQSAINTYMSKSRKIEVTGIDVLVKG